MHEFPKNGELRKFLQSLSENKQATYLQLTAN